MRNNEPLRFGRRYYQHISGDGQHFGFPFGIAYTLAFSRLLYGQDVLVASKCLRPAAQRFRHRGLNAAWRRVNHAISVRRAGTTAVGTAVDRSRFVRLNLPAFGFVILV
jgi:hypothetical protein